MSKLFGLPLILGLVAFVIGWLAAKFAAWVGARAANLEVPQQDRAIRALEANLRVVRKDADEATEKLATTTQELITLRESLDNLEETLQFREGELAEARKAVKDESSKVAELRRTLTDRAEETIRANASARDYETELSVLKAGASVIVDEVARLEAERDELTNRQRALESGAADRDDAASPALGPDKFMSDC